MTKEPGPAEGQRLWSRIGIAYTIVYGIVVLLLTGLLLVFAWTAIQVVVSGGSWGWGVLAGVILLLLLSAWVAIVRSIRASRKTES